MDEDGDFIIVWESKNQDGSGSGVFAQRYNNDGSTNGSEFKINKADSTTTKRVGLSKTPDIATVYG